MSEPDSNTRNEPSDVHTPVPSAVESSADSAKPVRVIVEFPPTRWTLVLDAAEGDDAKARQAMVELCEHYRSAIRGYFRLKCHDAHAAEDLAGAFVLHLLEKNRFRKFARRENMRFRNYLSRALKYFFCDHLPEPSLEPVDSYLETSGEDPEIEKLIDAELALATHERALAAMNENYRKHGKAARVEQLRPFILNDPEGDDYQRAATEQGLTLNALYQRVFRLRNDYYERFRAEVAQTVRHCKEELDDETRYLLALVPAALAERGGKP